MKSLHNIVIINWISDIFCRNSVFGIKKTFNWKKILPWLFIYIGEGGYVVSTIKYKKWRSVKKSWAQKELRHTGRLTLKNARNAADVADRSTTRKYRLLLQLQSHEGGFDDVWRHAFLTFSPRNWASKHASAHLISISHSHDPDASAN